VQHSESGTTALEIVVKEGRKRMVRRMCSAVGHPVQRLVRTRIGPVRDTRLAPGAWRVLQPDEVRGLYAAALDRPAPRRRVT
jgi:23S rRNA pseudouridine2605 synthase